MFAPTGARGGFLGKKGAVVVGRPIEGARPGRWAKPVDGRGSLSPAFPPFHSPVSPPPIATMRQRLAAVARRALVQAALLSAALASLGGATRLPAPANVRCTASNSHGFYVEWDAIASGAADAYAVAAAAVPREAEGGRASSPSTFSSPISSSSSSSSSSLPPPAAMRTVEGGNSSAAALLDLVPGQAYAVTVRGHPSRALTLGWAWDEADASPAVLCRTAALGSGSGSGSGMGGSGIGGSGSGSGSSSSSSGSVGSAASPPSSSSAYTPPALRLRLAPGVAGPQASAVVLQAAAAAASAEARSVFHLALGPREVAAAAPAIQRALTMDGPAFVRQAAAAVRAAPAPWRHMALQADGADRVFTVKGLQPGLAYAVLAGASCDANGRNPQPEDCAEVRPALLTRVLVPLPFAASPPSGVVALPSPH